MCTFIGVECLAVNALIELSKNNISKIAFKQLARYGLSVVEQYKQVQKQDAILCFDPNDLQNLVANYFTFFNIVDEEETGQKFICLKPHADTTILKEQFRWTLSYSMLKALKRVNIMEAITEE